LHGIQSHVANISRIMPCDQRRINMLRPLLSRRSPARTSVQRGQPGIEIRAHTYFNSPLIKPLARAFGRRRK
jgi:hypothetical protein